MSPAAIASKKDAQDVANVGESVESLARTFESLMTEIRKQMKSRVQFLSWRLFRGA